VVVYDADGRPDVLRPGEPPEPPPAAAPVDAFVALLRGGADNPAPGELGARAVEFVAAAYASAGSGA
jgi:predicted dehydrogenase